MFEFIKRNWKVILIGIVGLTLGFLLNIYANTQSEKRIIDAIIAEIQEIKNKQNSGRITSEEQKKLIQLQAQLDILQS